VANTDSFWSRLNLQAKIFLLCLLLVVVLSGTLLVFSVRRSDALAMESLSAALVSTRDLYVNLERDRLQKLSLINRVVAEAPYFKAAVAEMDPATTLDSASAMVDDVGSDFMIVTDFEGRVVARTDIPQQEGVDLSEDPLVSYALEGDESGGVWLEEGRLYHAVSVPLLFGPELVGTIVSGYEIGDTLATDVQRFANCQVAFFALSAGGYSSTGSTLAESTGSLAGWLASQPIEADADGRRVALAGENYQAILAPLETADEESVGLFVALRSRDEALAPFQAFQRSVLLAGLVGVVLAAFASHFLAKGLARPIQRLVEVTNKIREGDYRSEVQVTTGGEIGALAKAFRALLGELREKQVMEKFLSQSAAEMIQRNDGSRSGANSESRPVTVLFSDLKAYSVMQGQAAQPSKVIGRVNEALSRQADLVERYGGSVDKFIGDRMMAVFKGDDRVWPAIRCAISIQHLMELDEEEQPLVPGMGVSSGEAVFGAVGSSNRLDYTLLGPAVHIAGRLATDAQPGEVLLSGDAYGQVQDRTAAEALPSMALIGLDAPVPIYSLSTGTNRQAQLSQSRAAALDDGSPTVVDGASRASGADRREASISVSSLEPGTLLGPRYEIRRVLGSGGMGMVFQAHDRDLDEPIAVKVLRPEIASMDPTILERFKTEIRVARRIAHRNVVKTFDFGEAGGIRFITMEFVQGMTLKQLVRNRGALPIGVGLQIAKQACAGLVAAHEANVVHRDVKPQNIMLTPQSEVKIMDFGIVREKDKAAETQTGMIVGTPDYMSPEQAQGKADLDHRSDVYSLGIVLYEIFTGVLPFEGESPLSVAMKHVREPPPPPRTIQKNLPVALQDVILRCLKKDPAERYEKMSHLHGELYRISVAAKS